MLDRNFLVVKTIMLSLIRNDIEYINKYEGENYCIDCFLKMHKNEINDMIKSIIEDGNEFEPDDVLNEYIKRYIIYNCEDIKWLEYDCKCDDNLSNNETELSKSIRYMDGRYIGYDL